MNETRKSRLERKGWKFGSTQDFLGLSAEESAYIDLKLRLGGELKLRRRQRQLTQAELARTLKSSQSRVARMEAGDPSVSIDLLIRSLLALGASPREIGHTISWPAN